jgi:nitrate/TMAO reductase-like tetraheme cytochrome c subunit
LKLRIQVKLIGTIDTPEKFDAKRHDMAQNVWREMEENNSRECRNCHDTSRMNAGRQKEPAAKQHALAQSENKTCLDCHKGIAHKLSDKFMEIEHEQYLEEEESCTQCHVDM